MPAVGVESAKEGGVFSNFFTKTNLAIGVVGFLVGGPLGVGAAIGGIIGWERSKDSKLIDRIGATIIGGLLGTAAVVTAAVATIASTVLGFFAGPVGAVAGFIGGASASVYGINKVLTKVTRAQEAFRGAARPAMEAVKAMRGVRHGKEEHEKQHKHEQGQGMGEKFKGVVTELGRRFLGHSRTEGKGGESTKGKGREESERGH